MTGDVQELDSEQRYETVVEAMAEGVVLQDRSAAILACNQAAERILGLTRDQMMGRTSLDPRWRAIHEDGSPFPGETHPVPVTLATGQAQRDVIMGVHKPDGSRSWVSINSLPVFRGGEERPFAAVCTFSDITARVDAERALAASEQRYRHIVETSMDGVWIVDIDTGACDFANQRMAEILGTSVDELRARPVWSWLEPEDAALVRDKQRERASGKREIYDLRLRRADGRHVHCSVAASPLEGADGRRLALAMIRDLTATLHAAEALAQSQARIQQAFEVAKIGWFEDDFTIGQATVSPELRAICGWGPDVAPSHEAWDALIHPDDRPAQREAFARAAEGRATGRLSAEFRIVRNGATRWVHATARVECDPASGRPRFVGVLMDVTERKLLEEHLLESRKLESLGRLAGGVAHDFNNLLTAIFASLTLAERADRAERRVELDTIRVAADRAAALVRQLLAVARKQVIELRAIDLNAMIGELGTMLRRLVGEHIRLVSRPAPGLWTVRADLTQLEQVLINLVVNARDAMPDGGTLTIEARNAAGEGAPDIAPGDYVVLEVTDTGVGIDDDTLAHIFEPFFTTKRTGTGLGLASAYGTLRQLGGHIHARGRPGEGATFTVYLPRWAGEAEPAFEPAPRGPVGAIHETVMLVEDDALLRDVVGRGLAELGYRVLPASDGEDALTVAARHAGRIDLVISDVLMPRLSGLQLLERIRPLHPEARILFVSGYAENIVVRHGLIEPGVALLAKPFTIDALAVRIRDVLDRVD